MADVLSEIRSGLEKRLRELEPLIKEHAQVREALDALKSAGTRAERAVKNAAKPQSTVVAGCEAFGVSRGLAGRAVSWFRRLEGSRALASRAGGSFAGWLGRAVSAGLVCWSWSRRAVLRRALVML